MDTHRLLALTTVDWLGIPRDTTTTGGSITDPQSQMRSILLLAVALLLVLWLLSRVQSRLRGQPRRHRPYTIFRGLLKHHDIGRGDRMMLSILALSCGLRQPVQLLLSPTLFARYAEKWLSGAASSRFWPSARKRLVRVAQKVFGEKELAILPVSEAA